jgi:hypothetical protein
MLSKLLGQQFLPGMAPKALESGDPMVFLELLARDTGPGHSSNAVQVTGQKTQFGQA